MYQAEMTFRVRYSEADRMGILFHGHYVNYYEIGRTETIRRLGITYREIEDRGVFMPVTDISIKYLGPARYDEEISLVTEIPQLPEIRMSVNGYMKNEAGEIINRSEVRLAFIERGTNRIVHAPEYLLEKLRPYF